MSTPAPSPSDSSAESPSTPTAGTSTMPESGTHPPEQPHSSPRIAEEQRIQEDIPWGIRIAASWSWRIIIILIAAGVAIWLLGHVMLLLIPLMIAGLLSTLIRPLHNVFVKLKFPKVLAAITTIIAMLAAITGILFLVGQEIVTGFADMAEQVETGIYELIDWADQTAQGLGFQISTEEFNQAIDEVVGWIQENQDAIMSSAGAFGSAATNFGVGAVLVIFTLIFFLADGRKLWDYMTLFVPGKHRPAIHGAGRRGWTAVGTYMRVQVFVAFVDAVGIYIGAVILDIPLALPIAVLVFFGGFVPVVGAVVTGAVAVIVALVDQGFVTALIMLGVVILVQQIESNVLQPIVMGKAVKLHPLAVVLAVTAGTTLMGILGALVAVPILAFAKRATQYLKKEEWRGDAEALEMQRTQAEEAFRRAAQKEVIEAEEQASRETIKRRVKETVPGLHPDRPVFGRSGSDSSDSGRSVPAGRPAAEDGPSSQSSSSDEDGPSVPAPKPATDERPRDGDS
ncbi:AI-2E family transporter [Nesterenkonia populi]|uniref:AI-2E family transporter n=1 Tax=Nesterenkonia populi TaxID=1591087 RepID=UPI0011BEBCF9|nr:AI-2E family transporter [Nesterenkonia populi]